MNTLPRIPGDLQTRLRAARKHVDDLAQDRASWRMRIPAQADDSDLLLATTLDDAEARIAELEKGISRIASLPERVGPNHGDAAANEAYFIAKALVGSKP